MLIYKFVIIVLISEKEGEFKKYGIYNSRQSCWPCP